MANVETTNYLYKYLRSSFEFCWMWTFFSLNQFFLTFLLYVRQTWMVPLILAISLWRIIFFYYERILLLVCMVSQFVWRKNFLFHETNLKHSVDSYLKDLPTLVSNSFFLYWSAYLSLCMVFDTISCSIDEVLSISINPSANVVVFGDLNIHRKD